ncbi:hypothetical protein FQA39_LY16085 [Lamprigera yunnana]|nr:hypothetical protein FQA39_LY16085 [Lamprigera yunnana]
MNSSDEYSLNWSNHTNHIKKAFGNLFSGSEFVDVTLSCEGKKITAHKMLLSACSIYFHDLFRDNACQHPIVIFKDVKYQNLVNILKFIYCGEASVATEDFDDFLKTAELLQISGLTDEDTRNSMTEKEKEVSETTNVIVDDQKQVCEKETVVRKRKSEVDNVVDSVEKKTKVGEMNFDVVIKEEDIIHVDESSSYIKVPLEFEENDKSTTVESLQLDDSQSSLDILDISSADFPNENYPTDPLQCHLCYKKFVHPLSVKHHMYVHMGATKCQICGAVLSRKYDLKLHIIAKHRSALHA